MIEDERARQAALEQKQRDCKHDWLKGASDAGHTCRHCWMAKATFDEIERRKQR